MRVLLFILFAVLLTACGQKGPLFLPVSSDIDNKDEQKPLQMMDKKSTEVSK